MFLQPMLAVIPARGGSKGLPGKNIRFLAGLPLIVHSIRCAKLCPGIDRTIVSTDSAEIAAVARENDGDVPFLRPADLASDQAAMEPVLQHALRFVEEQEHRRYESLLLLDPTSPCRLPSDISSAIGRLDADPTADGVIGVSLPEFSPYWHCVLERDGYLAFLMPGAERVTRRQDLPKVYRINGMLYVWRRDYLLAANNSLLAGRLLLHEVPESRAFNIDNLDEFERAALMIREKRVRLPWLESR